MSFMPFNLLGLIPDILMGRNPKDALLGNALAVTGTLAAPGLLNPAGVATPGYMVAEQAAAPVVNMSTPAGLLDKANYAMGNTFSPGGTGAKMLDVANKMAKPVEAGMKAATMFQKEPYQLPPPPSIVPPTASPTLGQLVQGNQQAELQRQQEEMQRRMLQRQRIGMMGGRY